MPYIVIPETKEAIQKTNILPINSGFIVHRLLLYVTSAVKNVVKPCVKESLKVGMKEEVHPALAKVESHGLLLIDPASTKKYNPNLKIK